MRDDLADVTIVVDRSGSMEACRDDAEGGVNQFIKDQKGHDGECTFSLVQFDTEYEFVFKGVPIGEVGRYTLQPRGGTALLDAVGRAINEAGERLSSMNEADRPRLVAFVIVTDGQENSSREFTRPQIKEMIERQQNEYNWKFTFLGADQDAFAEASSMGIPMAAAASYSISNAAHAFKGSSSAILRAREAAASGLETISLSYTEDERAEME